MRQMGLSGLSDHLKRLSACGDRRRRWTESLISKRLVRRRSRQSMAYGDGVKCGCPPYDPVTMFKVLILPAQNTVGNGRMEYLIRDRLS